tara:strand:- start:1432 stop:1782 length:351 start_codon:yes stop_codon:yes gene_type:complete
MNPNVLKEAPMTMAEVKEHLAMIKERDGELNFRANKTEEALQGTVDVATKKIAELKAKLLKMDIPRLKEQHVCKICDILPESVEELKVVLQGFTITVTNDNMKKIVDTVTAILPKK